VGDFRATTSRWFVVDGGCRRGEFFGSHSVEWDEQCKAHQAGKLQLKFIQVRARLSRGVLRTLNFLARGPFSPEWAKKVSRRSEGKQLKPGFKRAETRYPVKLIDRLSLRHVF